MKRFAGWLLGLLVLLAAPARAESVADVVAAAHARGAFDGLVLQGDGDAIVYQGAFGLRDRAARRPHRLSESWRWASVTKQIAAVIAMQDVERGALSLDDTVAQRLPGYAAPNAARITVRQLLTHTSGLPDPDATPETSGGVPAFYLAPKPDLAYCAGAPRAEPGSGFHYNNCDTLVLAAILERLNGVSFGDLVRARIAAPLKLRSVGLYTSDRKFPAPPKAYDAAGVPEPPISMPSFGASAGLYGTIGELWSFDRALMGGKLLGASSLEQLWKGDPSLGYVALGAWSYTAKPPGCAAPIRLVERQGAVGNVAVLNLLAPDRKSALILFSNTSTQWGAVWNNTGLITDVVRAAWCQDRKG